MSLLAAEVMLYPQLHPERRACISQQLQLGGACCAISFDEFAKTLSNGGNRETGSWRTKVRQGFLSQIKNGDFSLLEVARKVLVKLGEIIRD